jgi:xylulokinase
MHILTLDIGTSSAKAAIWHNNRMGPVVRTAIPNKLSGIRAEISPASLLTAVEKTVREAVAVSGGKPLDALAFDMFSSAVLVTDRNFKPRTPIITHADRRSVDQSHAIEKQIGPARILKRAGNRPVPGGIGSSTLRWLAENTSALGNRPRVGQASAFVLQHWSGQFLIDPSQAAFLGLYDIRKKSWQADLCRAAKTPLSALPEIVFADQILGRLTSSAARRLGLAAGLPILGGLIDTGAAIIAASADLAPGTLVHNAGSTDVLALILERPQPGPAHLTRPLGTGAALPARWLAASTIAASGSAISWIRTALFRDLDDVRFAAALATACSQLPGAHYPLPSFTPHLAGDRTSIEQDRAVLSGLTLSTRREDILAGLVAGLVGASMVRFANLSRLVHGHIRPTIHTMGGATTLGRAMHRAWPNAASYAFRPIPGEALRGLCLLAQAALNKSEA